MGIKMGAVVRRFLIVFIQDLRNDINGLLIVELRVVMKSLMCRMMRMGMIMTVVMVFMVVIVVMNMIRDRAAAVFTHIFSLEGEVFIYYNAKGAKPLLLR